MTLPDETKRHENVLIQFYLGQTSVIAVEGEKNSELQASRQ
jgi:hypothetical protein